MKKLTVLLSSVFIFSVFMSKADEGMWLSSMLEKNYEARKEKGFKLIPEDIYNVNKDCLKDVVLSFGKKSNPFLHFCREKIVLDQSLSLTHREHGRIQTHLWLENDYLQNGFGAMKRESQLSKAGVTSSVLVKMEDVTQQTSEVSKNKMSEKKRRAIGGRIGWSIGPSYQHGIGEKNMLQADLDIAGFFSIQGTATFNWVFPINSWKGVGSWNWYIGGGIGAGYAWWGDLLRGTRYGIGYRHYRGYGGWGCGFVGVALMGGVEYNFKFPLQVFADYRPLIGPCFYRGGGVDFYYSGLLSGALCVGARYRLGK